MVKKLFGLASMTALAGLVMAVAASGCSGRITGYADDASADGSLLQPGDPGYLGYEAGKKPPVKIDASEPDPDPLACPSTATITAADVDAQLQWQPPAAFVNVCTQQNIDDLKNLFKNAPPGGGVKYADIKNALGATCAACAFSPIKGATWQVFVEDTSGAIDNRTGSCFAQRSGAACGRARFRFETCLDLACSEADCGADKVAACAQKAQKGACKGITDDYAKACPDETDLLPPCGNIFGSIATSCSGGPTNTIDTTP